MTAETERPRPRTTFRLPPGSEAGAPPERRGIPRDEVRLLVASRAGTQHRRFRDLPGLLSPGDLLVVNTSATLPAAVAGRRGDRPPVPVHLSTVLDDGTWVVEVRRPDGKGPAADVSAGETLDLPAGVRLAVEDSYPVPRVAGSRLWRAAPSPHVPAADFLRAHGRPITYGYLHGRYPIEDYQTVYATGPGSAEMASAGRPFTERLLVRLMVLGVTVAPVVLHAGVSSAEASEPPGAESFEVPADTARLVNSARAAGRRVIAVGTTVVRALETVADSLGSVREGQGWTSLVLGPQRPARVVTGLVTGLHAPGASHLLLLEAVAGADLVRSAYDAAVERRYLWQEFGDSTLFLP